MKLAVAVASLLGVAFFLFTWGQQMQAECLPQRGLSCVEDVVTNQLAVGMAAVGVGMLVIGLAMWLYNVGVNGFLDDLKATAGEPVTKRRK